MMPLFIAVRISSWLATILTIANIAESPLNYALMNFGIFLKPLITIPWRHPIPCKPFISTIRHGSVRRGVTLAFHFLHNLCKYVALTRSEATSLVDWFFFGGSSLRDWFRVNSHAFTLLHIAHH